METKRLLSAIENERHVTLMSLRKMGKTGLIHHVFNKLEKKYGCVYLDIMPTTSLREFTQVFGKAVLNQLERPLSKSFQAISEIFKKLRPALSVDPFSGIPTLELDIKTESESETSLEEIFKYLKTKKKKTIVAIDEFQQINAYPEKKTEALLRSYIQHLPYAVFVFSGSQKHTLASMFHDSSRPFYQSAEMLFMDHIGKEEYSTFIENHFHKNKVKIQKEAIELILEWTRIHTHYVQVLCNKLYSEGRRAIDKKMVMETAQGILYENESSFYSYRNLLTTQQWNLLKAIAKEEEVGKINQKAFLNKYHLGASSVQRSIAALTEREMVILDNDVYKVYDVFLSRWLQQLP